MRDKGLILDSIRSAKWNLYIIFLVNIIFIQFFAPFQYKCNFTEEKCITCGLRTAVDLFLHGHFTEAYQSNKLIVILAAIFTIILADIVMYLRKHIHSLKLIA